MSEQTNQTQRQSVAIQQPSVRVVWVDADAFNRLGENGSQLTAFADGSQPGKTVPALLVTDPLPLDWQECYENVCRVLHKHLDPLGLDPQADLLELHQKLGELAAAVKSQERIAKTHP
jgi:hypothetical protein